MALELELISPIDVAKDVALAVQEYTLLSAQSAGKLLPPPSVHGRHAAAGGPDRRRSLPIVILTGLSVGALLR